MFRYRSDERPAGRSKPLLKINFNLLQPISRPLTLIVYPYGRLQNNGLCSVTSFSLASRNCSANPLIRHTKCPLTLWIAAIDRWSRRCSSRSANSCRVCAVDLRESTTVRSRASHLSSAALAMCLSDLTSKSSVAILVVSSGSEAWGVGSGELRSLERMKFE